MNKTKTLKFRVSEDEERIIRRNADKCGMNTSAYIRKSVFGDKIIVCDNGAIYMLCSNIRAIGNNINQIARVANSCRSVNTRDIEELRSKIDKAERLINDYFSTARAG